MKRRFNLFSVVHFSLLFLAIQTFLFGFFILTAPSKHKKSASVKTWNCDFLRNEPLTKRYVFAPSQEKEVGCSGEGCTLSHYLNWQVSQSANENSVHVVSVSEPPPNDNLLRRVYIDLKRQSSAFTLVLVNQTPVLWDFGQAQENVLKRVIFAGPAPSAYSSLAASTPVEFFGDGSLCGFSYQWEEEKNDDREFARMMAAITRYIGTEPTSFQGRAMAESFRVPYYYTRFEKEKARQMDFSEKRKGALREVASADNHLGSVYEIERGVLKFKGWQAKQFFSADKLPQADLYKRDSYTQFLPLEESSDQISSALLNTRGRFFGVGAAGKWVWPRKSVSAFTYNPQTETVFAVSQKRQLMRLKRGDANWTMLGGAHLARVEALATSGDGSVWGLNYAVQGSELLHWSSEGKLLRRVPLGDFQRQNRFEIFEAKIESDEFRLKRFGPANPAGSETRISLVTGLVTELGQSQQTSVPAQ